MPIHKAFHMEMQHAFTMNATQVWFSLYSGAFDPMSLQIVALFDEIAAGLEYYEVIDNTPTRESFSKVVERIKFLQKRSTIFPDGSALTASYQGTDFGLETLYDLVGWIFSVTGNTPGDATAANYYYPLIVLYCQWCRTLCGKVEKEPQMVQITWFPQGSTIRVCIGGNLDRPKKLRKDIARTNRFGMLLAHGLAQEDEMEKRYTDDGGQLIGHCAETFPMLFIKSLKDKVTLPDVRGVAVKPFEALGEGVANKFAVPDTVPLRQQLLEDPCKNCKVVLPRLGSINLDHFNILNL
ncbi:hypothetical protein P692DRAFT_20819074 [Suillus brevipes Sb2]|nr:hypothetical protein P692DRAFT_20819074 [Suillus brevipes Sb2]